jgi:ATP-dependent Clp protease ATP-binding subunit ClpC
MFERYTEKARRVIFFSRYEASEVGSSAIEPEHILLGLLREDKDFAERTFGDPYSAIESIRNELRERSGSRDKVSASVDLPLSHSAKRVLSHAADESDRLGHRHIGTEHLVLGILRDDLTDAAERLYRRGLTLETAREAQKDKSRAEPGYESKLPATGLQLSERLMTLMRILIRRGVINERDFDQEIGLSHVGLRFSSLVELLVRRGAITEDDRREINGSSE